MLTPDGAHFRLHRAAGHEALLRPAGVGHQGVVAAFGADSRSKPRAIWGHVRVHVFSRQTVAPS
jgi:hypothetical protein